MGTGQFIISLDFELNWGVRDAISFKNYKENLDNTRKAILAILSLFQKYDVHATWATIGFLFCESKIELEKYIPKNRPSYTNKKLNYVDHIQNVGPNENNDPYHYALSVIKKISGYDHQEIASHSFSHFYALEKGQNVDQFSEDLKSSISVAKDKLDIELSSLVFPRNQVNKDYLETLKTCNITSYRGTESSFYYQPGNNSRTSRALRLIDTYFNLSGYNCFRLTDQKGKQPYNFPSSRFLRPFSNKYSGMENLKFKRIIKSMQYAASKGLAFHLWWHPHNFGTNLDKNIMMLENIIVTFKELENKYGMISYNMKELSDLLDE